MRSLSSRVSVTMALVAAGWLTTTSPTATSSPAWAHLVEIGDPASLAARLDMAARDGWELAAVAKPDPGPLPRLPMVVLARQEGATPRTAEYAIATGPRTADLEDDINDLAAEGFRLRGVSWTAPIGGRGLRLYHAVLERAIPDAPAEFDYRVVRTTGQAAEWRQLVQAGREGFRVGHVLWFPDPQQSAAGEVIFFAERRTGAAEPLEYDTLFDGSEHGLTNDVNKKAKAGYEVAAMWTSRDYANVLLVRPRDAAKRQPAEFAFDDQPGSPSIGIRNGRFLDMVGRNDTFLTAYDKGGRGVYQTVHEVVIDEAERFGSDVFDPYLAVRSLNRAGREGFRAFGAALWPDDDGKFRLRVYLERP